MSLTPPSPPSPPSTSPPPLPLLLTPIGIIHTEKRLKFDAPHQPLDGVDEHNVIELLPGSHFEQALKDLAGFDRIWLLWWFHRNASWRPLVLPPRGPNKRRGVFATRSPHRPNPIGMTAVRLLSVKKLRITVGNCDLVDGTPILDIKPYVATVDAFSDSSLGWLAEVEEALKLPPKFSIEISSRAKDQLTWLQENWQIEFTKRAFEILERDPSVHRTRRIRRLPPEGSERRFVIGCGTWMLRFTVRDTCVVIKEVAPGYPARLLAKSGYEQIPDHAAQVAFTQVWLTTGPTGN